MSELLNDPTVPYQVRRLDLPLLAQEAMKHAELERGLVAGLQALLRDRDDWRKLAAVLPAARLAAGLAGLRSRSLAGYPEVVLTHVSYTGGGCQPLLSYFEQLADSRIATDNEYVIR